MSIKGIMNAINKGYDEYAEDKYKRDIKRIARQQGALARSRERNRIAIENSKLRKEKAEAKAALYKAESSRRAAKREVTGLTFSSLVSLRKSAEELFGTSHRTKHRVATRKTARKTTARKTTKRR